MAKMASLEEQQISNLEDYVKGKQDEQERIIKLLEGYALQKCDDLCAYQCECYGKFEAKQFIELIKGEQK